MKGLAVLLLCCSPALSGAATDVPLPPGTPDYTGICSTNFFERAAAIPSTDYAMPKVVVSNALIVASDGSDSAAGTVEKPFRTLGRAAKQIKPGTVILLRRGAYTLDSAVKLDGAAGQKGSREHPVLIASYPGELATLVGCAAVSNWTRLGETSVFYHDFTNAVEGPVAVWFNDKLLPSIRHHVYATTENPPFKEKNLLPLEGPSPLSASGTWAIEGKRLFLRAPGDSDPDQARVEISSPGKGNGSVTLARAEWVIFHRIAFRKHAQAALCSTSPYAIFRECLFENCSYAITFFGGDAAERGIVDGCMFHRIGNGAQGEAIYCTAPMTIRHSLFSDVGPLLSIAAYTSKNDAFSGLRVIGNTFLHGGACITSTGKGSLIQNNVALGSRFLSSAGSDAQIEGNVAVYDPRDLAEWPKTPRRNIGFRLYGRNAKVFNNTFVGFAQGGSIYKPEGGVGGPAPVEVRGNKFYGYTEYALRIHDPANLTCEQTLFAPASTNASAVYLTPDQQHKTHLSLAEWQTRGFDSNGVWKAGATISAPRVIQQAAP
jgi:hypothetical protein